MTPHDVPLESAETRAEETLASAESTPGRSGGRLKRIVRALIAFAIVAFAVVVLVMSISSTGNAAHKDFISYWAAGHLLLQHSNPYDAAAVFRLEKSVGFSEPQPLVMRNPPSALLLAIPLGVLRPAPGVVLWSLLILACLFASIRLLWTIHGKPPDRLHLLGYLFAPAFACMQLGQTSTVILLGVVLFLYWHRDHPFAAGLCVPLMVIKPHLLLPFGLVLLAWIVVRRAYPVLMGAIVGLIVATAAPLYFDHSLWRDYLSVLRSANADTAMMPTISTLTRMAIAPASNWLQFVPVILGCAWAMLYFLRHEREWDWNGNGVLLLAVSLFVAPYSWFSDEIVVLPAILAAIYCCAKEDRSLTGFVILNGAALLLVFSGIHMWSLAFVWTTTAWLGWYLFATREDQWLIDG